MHDEASGRTTGAERTFGEKLVVVTVTYSPGETIEHLLASVKDAAVETPLFIMSDNGSTDGAVEAAEQKFPFARARWNGANLGYGAAINVAVGDLGDDYGWILVVNPDCEFAPGSIDTMVAAARADDTVGAVGPLIVSADGVPYPSARQLPSLRTGIGHALLAGVWPNNPWSVRYRQDDVVARGETVPTGWLSGACVLVRRSAFEQVGGFDDRFFMYFEDVDLGRKLGLAGWTNLYLPTARVMHIGASTASKHPVRTLRAHHDSAYRYMAKKHPQWWLAPVRLVIRVGLAVRLWSILRDARRHPDHTPRTG
jgi:N-acetylglucosaminyl-diphospho-decaprenol L-rhamnosyltransferase